MAVRGFELAKISTRPDPMFSFKWMCIDGTLPFDHPIEYLEAIDIPLNNIKSDSVPVGSGYLVYPGTHEIEGFSMSLYEDQNGKSLQWILGWKSKIKNFKNGHYGLPIDYKRDIRIGLMDTKGNVTVEALLIGVWPTQTSNYSLNYNESGRLVLQQTFVLDDMDLKFNSV